MGSGTYHFAYSGLTELGISQDVSLLLDEDEVGAPTTAADLSELLTGFIRACGWPQEATVTIQ